MTILNKLFRATAFKLTLVIFGLSVVGSAVVLGVVAWQVIKLVDAETQQTIAEQAKGLAEQYDAGGVRRLGEVIDKRSHQPGSSLYLLTNNAGEPLAGNVAQLPPGVLDQVGVVDTPYETVDESAPGRRALARIFALPGGFRLLVGRDLGDRARIGAVMVRAMAVSLIFFAALAALGALFVARRVLNRIDAMNRSARAIMAGDLTLRLPVSGSGDELDRLAAGLNDMLARIAELMTGLREVSDNIAHDLRTPLTRLRNHAEAALRSADDPAAYRAALERTIEESDGLIRVFNALLAIARAEAGAESAGVGAFDIGEAVESVAELYAPVAEENGATLKVEATRGLMVVGNRELIGQAVANLIDNAVKHGAPEDEAAAKTEISVVARRDGASVAIEVADHGPGIPADDRARALERFVRLEGARSRPGSGLGLSLVAAVMRMHGGALRLDDNSPGLKVTATLPAAAEAPRLPVAQAAA
ncbi:MAG: ATP-binding protein [Roseiarcus sp.]|uniref:sensor histidine kinase n=1 Tax=Roseiarcus sp. TaxID=1969460 RepID=UPI003C25B961